MKKFLTYLLVIYPLIPAILRKHITLPMPVDLLLSSTMPPAVILMNMLGSGITIKQIMKSRHRSILYGTSVAIFLFSLLSALQIITVIPNILLEYMTCPQVLACVLIKFTIYFLIIANVVTMIRDTARYNQGRPLY